MCIRFVTRLRMDKLFTNGETNAMEKQRVELLLKQLHEELSTAGPLDEATAEKLRSTVDEIEETLEQSDLGKSQALVQRIREAIYHLPESHPAIKSTVGRIADALSQMGI